MERLAHALKVAFGVLLAGLLFAAVGVVFLHRLARWHCAALCRSAVFVGLRRRRDRIGARLRQLFTGRRR